MARTKRNPQGVFLKQIIKDFCNFAHAHKTVGHVLSPKRRQYFTLEDEVAGKSACNAFPTDVPKGHFAVYVGHERSRFIIPTAYLNHSLFKALLQKSEEEYGFDHQMGIIIPCEEVAFKYLTSMLRKKNPNLKNLELDEIIGVHCHGEMEYKG